MTRTSFSLILVLGFLSVVMAGMGKFFSSVCLGDGACAQTPTPMYVWVLFGSGMIILLVDLIAYYLLQKKVEKSS